MPFIPDDQNNQNNSFKADEQQETVDTLEQNRNNASLGAKIANKLSGFSSVYKAGASAIAGVTSRISGDKTRLKNERDFKKASQLTQQAKNTTNEQEKQRLLNEARSIMAEAGKRTAKLDQTITDQRTAANITDREMKMSNLEYAGRVGTSAALEAGSYMTPLPGGKPASSILGRIGQASLKGTVSGGLSGASRSALESESVGEASKKTAQSAALGGILSGLFATGGELKNIGKHGNEPGKALEKRREALEKWKEQTRGSKSAKASIKQHGGLEKMYKTAKKEGVELGSTHKLEKQLKEYGPKFEREVNKVLSKNSNKAISFDDALKQAIENIDDMYSGADAARAEYMKKYLLENYKKIQGTQTPESFNRLRQGLDKATQGKPADAIRAQTQEAQKFLVSSMRQEMKNKIPELAKPMDKYATMATFLDVMKPDRASNLLTMLAGGTASGGAIGTVVSGDPVGGALTGGGIALGTFGKRALTSPQAQRKLGIIMARRALQKPTTTAAPNILTNLVGRLPTAGSQSETR